MDSFTPPESSGSHSHNVSLQWAGHNRLLTHVFIVSMIPSPEHCAGCCLHTLMTVSAVVLESFMKIKLCSCAKNSLLDSGSVHRICLLNIVDPPFNNSQTSLSK